MEAACLVSNAGDALLWHSPPGRSSVALPDSVDLWTSIWEHRAVLAGVAHSHPGAGIPGPSRTDVTTFAAVESGLGRRLRWWIISRDHVIELRWVGPDPLQYGAVQVAPVACRWFDNLHKLSYDLPQPGVSL